MQRQRKTLISVSTSVCFLSLILLVPGSLVLIFCLKQKKCPFFASNCFFPFYNGNRWTTNCTVEVLLDATFPLRNVKFEESAGHFSHSVYVDVCVCVWVSKWVLCSVCVCMRKSSKPIRVLAVLAFYFSWTLFARGLTLSLFRQLTSWKYEPSTSKSISSTSLSWQFHPVSLFCVSFVKCISSLHLT